MSKAFQTVAILGLYSDSRVAGPMAKLTEYLTKAGIDVVTLPDAAATLEARAVQEDDIAAEVDLIIAVGGDGTMLHAAALTGSGKVPLLGVNRGRLGFLADITPAEMLENLEQILEGNYSRETRLLLEAKITAADGSQRLAVAVNDIVLQRRETGRMIDVETRIADRYVNTHAGDGLIVATPTGSTAYALSCGGPIIEPLLDAVVIVPICPHTLGDRPIVIPASLDIEVKLLPRHDTKAEVSVDGHSLGELDPDDRLLISESANRITLIHPPGYDYYGILRSKLHWGRDNRTRDQGGD
ncbi:MAG: NAD(+) kinase [Proteobacteria bacterium]|nr:NAD(+) kinase [Pseudomonadota bacterium]